MNEMTQLLAKPLPLGLMVVFFLVALAVFSLFLARTESRHRSVVEHYQDQLRAIQYAGQQGYGGSWAGVQPASVMPARSGSWVGWLLSVGAVLGVGVALLWTQLPGTASVVVPDLARLPGLSAEPSAVAMVEPPAVETSQEVSQLDSQVDSPEPKAPVQAALVPTQRVAAQANASAKPAVRAAQGQAPDSPRRAGFQDDAEIERMLAWERRRAAERTRARGQQGRASQGQAPRRVQKQRRAAAEPRRLPSADSRPAVKQAPSAAEPAPRQAAPEGVESSPVQVQVDEPALAQEPAPPRKRRKRLKLDQSGDPMGNI